MLLPSNSVTIDHLIGKGEDYLVIMHVHYFVSSWIHLNSFISSFFHAQVLVPSLFSLSLSVSQTLSLF